MPQHTGVFHPNGDREYSRGTAAASMRRDAAHARPCHRPEKAAKRAKRAVGQARRRPGGAASNGWPRSRGHTPRFELRDFPRSCGLTLCKTTKRRWLPPDLPNGGVFNTPRRASRAGMSRSGVCLSRTARTIASGTPARCCGRSIHGCRRPPGRRSFGDVLL